MNMRELKQVTAEGEGEKEKSRNGKPAQSTGVAI